MPRRLFLALLLLVAAPLVLLGWMSASAVKENQSAAKENLTTLLSSQLFDADRLVVELFADYARQLDAALESPTPLLETLRQIRREQPIVRQGIFVNPDGLLLYPLADDLHGADAAEVEAALPAMIDARPLSTGDSDSQPASSGKLSRGKLAPTAALTAQSAWQQWYMGDGAQVIYWRFSPNGGSVGILLQRSRWMADLIAALPDDSSSAAALDNQRSDASDRPSPGETISNTPIGSIALLDEAKRVIYRWGDLKNAQSQPLADTELSTPLASWHFQLKVDESLLPQATMIPLILSLTGIGLLVLAVGAYVLTSVGRQIASAKSRVSFAGQVSHELRTPLTNIRLYTELAESDLEQLDDGEARRSLAKRLQVIDHESRRLQRLVSGVLEMIRPSGKRVGVRKQPTDLADLIQGITAQFEPSFVAAGLSLESSCQCHDLVAVDPDVIELVLVNLLSNVEKYVPRGGHCSIQCTVLPSTDRTSDQLRILVQDDGPGIGALHREKVFRPFERLDDSIQAPSGTGIGLTIARRAARRHDGSLVLLPKSDKSGAAFELTLPLDPLHLPTAG
ncbi:HAMP domain-containing histidine kinase [Stieleria sp. TO1_6]|uniref:sensor histidine kinase n=1 Tax=Stieleria tagensis TaxID=2956795 RepID=UPI00209B6C10|nr:HAMP domain-containing sensor histidine kinase [Stieleria tagensis]MCO8124845.1 HAMP domain-containing histidine kinase [Stieleria tagensis]